MSSVSDEVRRVCAEFRVAEVNDIASHFVANGFSQELAKFMAEAVVRELERRAFGCAWALEELEPTDESHSEQD